jgi:hypothetical protein
MIILYILLAVLGSVVMYASDREKTSFSMSAYDLQEISCLHSASSFFWVPCCKQKGGDEKWYC